MPNSPSESLLASKPSSFTISKLTGSAPSSTPDALSVPVLVAFIVILIISVVLVATFWPVDEQEKVKRQRRYARVDELYFPVQAVLVNKETIEELSSLSEDPQRIERYFDTFLPIEIRVTSISLGGCAIKTDRPLEKGQMILLNLAQLPDFPSKHSFASFKVTWVRGPKHPDRDARIDIGLQITDTFQENTRDTLRRYLNYLLDDPAA